MKILFACSASGGHLFPALSTAREIKTRDNLTEILLLTERNRISRQILENCEFKVIFLDCKLGRCFSLQPVASIIKLLETAFKTFTVVRDYQPEVIVGFGGYVSVVPILLAKFLRIKTIIHEQNVILGRANRLLAQVCDCLAVSFKSTKNSFRQSGIFKKIKFCGLPLRKSLNRLDRQEASRFFNFDMRVLTILVLGGSLGSVAINKYFLQALRGLSFKGKLQIIHICGFKDEAFVRSFYQRHSNLDARIFPFLGEMASAYSAADLCICRSGASSIFELSLFKLPAILIPYPGARAHQFANARVLRDCAAAILLEERNLPESLKEKLNYLLSNTNELERLKRNFPTEMLFNPEERLCDIITK